MNIREAVIICAVLAAVAGCRQRDEAGTGVQFVTTDSGIDMAVLPGGWFEMGSADGQDDERPVRRVWVDAFWMDCYEVTQDLLRKFQISDPSHFKNPRGPMDQANWADAAVFCNERSLAEGLMPCYDEQTWECDFEADGYRLPTEAEWEYACRAGSRDRYSFGNNERLLGEYAWFADNSQGRTQTVGQKQPNAWGLYDMHGNVTEWCQDWYAADSYGRGDERNPRGPATGKERVLRGGSWKSSADACRASYRASDPSLDDTCLANDTIGFRCVRRAPAGGDAQAKE